MMTKKAILIWVIILTFGLASLPEFGFSTESKQTGNTELTKKKPRKKASKRKNSKRNLKKKKRGSRKLRSGGKKKYTKRVKYTRHKKYSKSRKHSRKYSKSKKYSKKKRYSSRKKRSYKRRYYSPSTNSNKVEYRNYKRNSDGENSSGNDEQNIEKIAPQKEIKKEPKKEGE
jgi:hypothetical protein